jgi:hypothetical protein
MNNGINHLSTGVKFRHHPQFLGKKRFFDFSTIKILEENGESWEETNGLGVVFIFPYGDGKAE